MEQLTGLDASFLYLETENSPMHIGALAIYDPSTAPGGKVGFKQIMENTLKRADKVAMLNNVLMEVPMGMDHPYWRTDGPFDPEFHIRHIALPKPGDWRQLCIQVARLHARPLDRARPLWEFYIVEGLNNLEGFPPGCFALVSKMHHAAIDGASGVEINEVIHDLTPDYGEITVPKIKKERALTNMELILKAQLNNIKTPFRFLSVARNTVPGFAKAIAGVARGKLDRVTDTPRTRFNSNVSPHRVFDAVEFDFKDVKAIKDAVEGVTVNDVAIAICGGGLRKYLLDKGELPEESLVAMAPVNIRTKDKLGTAGNQVSQMTVRVFSNIEDPVERLKAINVGTSSAKELTNAVGAKSMTDYAQFMPSTLSAAAARLSSRVGLANRIKPMYNCVITNVPGPQIPLYFTGARLMASYGLGPAIDGMGLFQCIFSYAGRINIGVSSCRSMMPDPSFYRDCLQESFDELLAATVPSSNKKTVASTSKAPAAKTAAKSTVRSKKVSKKKISKTSTS